MMKSKSDQYFILLGSFFFYLSELKYNGFIVSKDNSIGDLFESFLIFNRKSDEISNFDSRFEHEIAIVKRDILSGRFDHLSPHDINQD